MKSDKLRGTNMQEQIYVIHEFNQFIKDNEYGSNYFLKIEGFPTVDEAVCYLCDKLVPFTKNEMKKEYKVDKIYVTGDQSMRELKISGFANNEKVIVTQLSIHEIFLGKLGV